MTLALRLHVVPALGSLPLASLRPLHLQELYGELLASGMIAAGVRRVHAPLRAALNQAVKWQMLGMNPASAVTLPRVAHHGIQPLTEAETAHLLRAAQVPDGHKQTRLFAPVALALATGMRRGEILGLEWAQVDLDGATLFVTQALREDGKGLYVEPPKTTKGRRRIALPPFAVQILRAHRVAQDEERLQAGPAWKGGDYVFSGVGGGPWKPSNFSRAFRGLLVRAGEPSLNCRFHDLRHTHASQLARQGVNPKVVQERLGHANIGITMDIYSHLMADMQEDAARLTDEALQAALQSTVHKQCTNDCGDG